MVSNLSLSNNFELSKEELKRCDLIPGSFYSSKGLTNNAVLNTLTKARISPEFCSNHTKLAMKQEVFQSSTMASGGFRISKSAVLSSQSKVAKFSFLVITSVENTRVIPFYTNFLTLPMLMQWVSSQIQLSRVA